MMSPPPMPEANSIKSLFVDIQELTVGAKKKKRKRANKEARKRRRKKREVENKGIPLLHNQRAKISCSEETGSNPDCNNFDPIIELQPIHNHDTNPSNIASRINHSNDDDCSLTTSNILLSSSSVSSSGKSSSPPPLVVSSSSFGISTKFLALENRIEFVYPKNHQRCGEGQELSVRTNYGTSIISYVHTKLQDTVDVDNESILRSIKKTNRSKDEQVSALSIKDEDIDDILYPERKKKRIAKIERIKSTQDKNNVRSTRTLLQTDTQIEGNDGSFTSLENGDKMKHTTKTLHCHNDLRKEMVVSAGKETGENQVLNKGNETQKENNSNSVETECKDKRGGIRLAGKGYQTGAMRTLDQCNGRQEKTHERKDESILEDNAEITKIGSIKLRKRRLSGLTVEDALKDKVGRRPRCNSTDRELNLPQRGLCDEHMVLESHKWDVEKLYGQRSISNSPRGLINLGNTCFLNATLQCLAHLPTFCQCVAVMPSLHDGNNVVGPLSSQQRKTKKLGNFTNNLRLLLRKMHSLDGGKALNHGPAAPKDIVRALSQLGGSSRGHKFRSGRQEDAHEFLVHLMDMMHDGELKAAGIDQKKAGWRNKIPIPRLEETTFVHRIFGGYLRSQVKCTNCEYSSNTYDPFLDLSLEISAKSVKNISSAFAQFMRKETLDVKNKWKCDGCKKRVCATKQLTCFRPPLSLCIQLKRFAFSVGGSAGFVHHKGGWGFGHFSGKGMGMARGGSKIQKPIEFPALLKLPLSDGRKCDYELTGIVIHVGGSATSGHYTAYVRRPSSQGSHTNNWYHMDDSYVKPVSEKTVLKQKDAYLLFYCRKEVKLEIPLPPPRAMMNAGEAQMLGKVMARARARADSNLESQPKLDMHIGDTSIEVERAVKEKSNLLGESTILGVIPKNKVNNENLKTVDRTSIRGNNTKVKMESKYLENTAKVVQDGLEDTTTTDGTNCANIENSLVAKKSKCSNKSEEDKSDESDKRIARGNTTIPGSDPLIDNCSNYEKGDRSNAEVVGKKKKVSRKKKVVSVDIGQRGSVQVILNNPNKKNKRKWKPIEPSTNALLLGNVNAKGWEDDCPSERVNNNADLVRRMALEEIVKKTKSVKRKMYPDKWDAELDKGKTKKVKIKTYIDPQEHFEPKNNPFQLMQQKSMQKRKGGIKQYHSLKNKKNPSKNRKQCRKP